MADQTKGRKPKKGTGTLATGASRPTKSPGTVCPGCGTDNAPGSRFCSNCASPLKESGSRTIKAATFEIARGDLFAGRYEIIESLGQGGMGKVYKVYDRKLSEVLALKLIRPEIGVNDKAIERFKNELKIARRITHRNICRMFDLGEQDYLHFITMEYVAGEDLKRFIRRAGTLSAGKAVNIAKQVGEGLAEAHRLGVIHRDLKPQNIMIDQDGNAKIMDFGIARFIDAEGMTGSGVMIGTPEYMSPEQAELKEVDRRADIYSLGIVLYEMTCGKVPFEGETPLSIAMKHKTEKARNVRELNALIPVGLAVLIAKCMEKLPANRYQTAEELLAELGRLEPDLGTGERIVPKKTSPGTKAIVQAAGKKKFLLPAIGVAVAAAAVFIVLKVLPGKGSRSSPDTTQAAIGPIIPPAPPAAGSVPDKQLSSSGASPQTSEQKKEVQLQSQEKPAAPASKKPEPKTGAETPKTEAMDPEMSSTNLAQARMTAARAQALKQAGIDQSLFFKLAEANGQEGQKRFAQKNGIEARGQFMVAEKLFRICTESSKDEERIKSLKSFVKDLRDDVLDLKPSPAGEKPFLAAKEAETQAAACLAKKDLDGSAKWLIQAADYYQARLLAARAQKGK
jgi:serine/threonine protein kinase